MNHRFVFLVASTVVFALTLSGCGTFSNERKIDYRNTTTVPALEIPPDLTSLPDSATPAERTTYSGYTSEQRSGVPATAGTPVLPQSPGVRLAREGQMRFIVVNADPAAVWSKVRSFIDSMGLSIERENPKAGVIETQWAKNRAYVGAPEDSFFGKWLQSVQSASFRDKYHVRLERGVDPGTTEVYIAHRGMEEVELEPVYEGPRAGWKTRPSDPELEIEMLQRLALYIGNEQSPTKTAKAPLPVPALAAPSAHLTRNGSGAPLLALEDSIDRAWRRVGLSLDRIGFTVEDRDRSKGVYYVRYIDPETKAKEKGFFSRWFTKDEPPPPNQFQVHVKPNDNGSSVEVLDKEGGPEASKTGERILSLLYEQLK